MNTMYTAEYLTPSPWDLLRVTNRDRHEVVMELLLRQVRRVPPRVIRYRRFAWENPHIEPELVRMCEALMSQGAMHYSIAGLFEVLRYRHSLKTDAIVYKMADSHQAYYARDLMRNYSDLNKFFVLSNLKLKIPQQEQLYDSDIGIGRYPAHAADVVDYDWSEYKDYDFDPDPSYPDYYLT